MLSSIIRVNHAGEYGAKVIYTGQIKAFQIKKDYKNLKIVEEMKMQEEVHYDYFNKKIIDEKIRPTLLSPVWGVGGFILGFLTGIIDKRAAMCCTTAVEEVIDEHYQNQIKSLNNITSLENKGRSDDKNQQEAICELKEKIEQFRIEEVEHRDIGYDNRARDLPYFKPLSSFIKFITKTAIFLSKKI
jgi:ubiquinone biosynthesis monooxygenase Coq7